MKKTLTESILENFERLQAPKNKKLFNEGFYKDEKSLPPIPKDNITQMTLKDGTKLKLGIVADFSEGYFYAYITDDKKKYGYVYSSAYSKALLNAGVGHLFSFTPNTVFVKFI